jgi:hypothetical protein
MHKNPWKVLPVHALPLHHGHNQILADRRIRVEILDFDFTAANLSTVKLASFSVV